MVTETGAFIRAVGANEFLFGATEPVQLRLVLHTQLAFPREEPGLGVGGGRRWRFAAAAAAARHRGVPGG